MNKLDMEINSMVSNKVEKLMELFPNCITEKIVDENGKRVIQRAIDINIIKEEINIEVLEGNEERYQFTWPDKKKSMLLVNAPTNHTLLPIKDKSMEFEKAENIYIEGDNLEVLKVLHESYLGSVKLIYIDPPYNTGSDLIYEDDFAMSKNDFHVTSNQIDSMGNQLVKNLDSNGRFHTDWLNMLYPRIKVARELLTADGAIMISIDENENVNLRKMCDEIFGMNNFVGEIIRKTKSMTADNGNGFNNQHEYLCIYAKNKSLFVMQGEEKDFARYANPDNDPNGNWCTGDPSAKSGGNTTNFGIENPYTHRVDYPPKGRFWAFSQKTYEEYVKRGKIKFKEEYKENERGFIFKRYKKEITSTNEPVHSLFAIENEYMNQSATLELKKLLGENIFSYPKPVSFIKKLVQFATQDGDIIMDFFAGSATTGHAVLELNAECNGNRKFILVQVAEEIEPKNKYDTICDVGVERLNVVMEKLKEMNVEVGLRYFRLASSNMKDIYYSPAEMQQSLFHEYTDNIKEERTSEDLLFQVMLDLGILLSSKIVETTIAGKKIFNVADGFLIACFESNITDETVRAVARIQPNYAVFRDSCMSSDSVATNFNQIFMTHSPETIRKVL